MNSYFLSIDLNLPQKLEVVNLKHKLGYSGLGLYFEILLKLAQQNDYILSCDYELLAYDFRTDKEIIKQIIENFDLFELGNGVFYSVYVCEKMEELEKKKEAKRQAGIASGMARKRAKKRTEHRLNSVPTKDEQVVEQKRTIREENIIEDKIINREKVKESKIESFFANPLFELQKNKNFSLLTEEELKLTLETFFQSYPKASDLTTFNFLRDENNKKLKNNPIQKTNTNSKMEIEVEEQDLEMMRELYPTAILKIKK